MSKLRKVMLFLLALVFMLGTAAHASSFIELVGKYSYRFKGSRITLRAQKIRNNEPSGTRSGTLRYALWATKRPYSGGRIYGYRLADVYLGTLKGQYAFNNVVKTTTLKRPPSGRYYYITICVTEYSNGAHRIVDYRNFNKTQNF